MKGLTMKTEQQQFATYLNQKGYEGKTMYFSKNVLPSYRISPIGTHTLIYHIACVLFEGVDTKNGDLGCTTFCFYGKARKKNKQTIDNAEILKKCITCDKATEAIEEFELWLSNSLETLETWKVVI